MRSRVSRRVAFSEPERVQVRRWMARSWRSEGAGEQHLRQYPATASSVKRIERHGHSSCARGVAPQSTVPMDGRAVFLFPEAMRPGFSPHLHRK